MKQHELYHRMKEDKKLFDWDGVIYIAACITSIIIMLFVGRFIWGLLP